VAAKHLREVPTHATAGASGRGTTQALRLAITRTLNLSEAAPRTRVWVALAAASAILTGGTAAVRGVARGAHARAGDAAATSPELSLRPEADAKALRRHLADAHAAILGGRPSVARNAIQDALHIDDASAEARLALVRITSLWPDDAERATFVRAQDLREALKEDDRAYLEALAPGMTVPADYRQQADRLEGLHARVRGVLPVTLALADAWLRINKSDDAIGLLKPLAESPGAPALVLAAYANALSASDETDEAMTRLEHCATDYPAATSCLEQLSQLYLLEGRCPEAERVARKELALDANSTDGYFKLAFALDGERAPPSEVRNVLDKCSEHIDLSVRAVYKARFDEELALVEGRFKDALASDTELRVATSRLSTDAEHLDYTNRSMELKAELGLQVDAREVLSEYSVARQGLQRDTYGGDNVMYLNAVAASLDLLPRKGWLSLRASRLAAHMDRDDLQDGPERTWLEYFAIPANDPGSAREAIAALPKNRPFPRRSDRWPLHDGAIGNVLSLTGKAETATQYFERASASCMRLDNPIEYSRALLRFAEHLEREHQRDRACETYARILSAWPRDSGSITAATAAARTDAFCKNATRAKTH
jgi:tetratricopeptide (TPR) repeat protein